MQPSGLLRPTTQPVALPWDERPTQVRRLGVLIAALILVGTVAGGLLYQHLWEDVGHEITRILPASTTAFARISEPMIHLDKVSQLDRWSDPEGLRERWRTQGALSANPEVEIANVPLSTFSRSLRGLKTLELALVPTPAGSTTLVFVQFEAADASRRLFRALGDRVRVIDRLLGFDIFEINAAPPWLPWGDPKSPIHATLMDERLVLSIGPIEALEDLIEARVGGSSRPIRSRAGFDALSVQRDRTGFWAHLDEGLVGDAVHELLLPKHGVPLKVRAILSESIHGITMRSGIEHEDDALSLRVQAAPSSGPPWPTLQVSRATSGAHSLLRRMPISLSSVWSLSVDDPVKMLQFLEGLREVEREARATTEPQSAEREPDWIEGVSSLSSVLGRSGALTGDALLTSGSTDLAREHNRPVEWVFVLGIRDSVMVQEAQPDLIDQLLADGWTYGSVQGERRPLHIVQRGDTSWFWRQTGDVVVASSSERVLDMTGDWHPDQGAGGDEPTLFRALRNLPTESPLLFMLDPGLYRTHTPPSSAPSSGAEPAPWHELLTLDLRPDFRFAGAVQFRDDGVAIYTNLGIWTILAEMAATALETLETRMIGNLLPECRAAYATMCSSRGSSPLCAKFLPGRSRVVARACARLKARGLLPSEETGSEPPSGSR